MSLEPEPLNEPNARLRRGLCLRVAVAVDHRVQDGRLLAAKPPPEARGNAGVYLGPLDQHRANRLAVQRDRVNVPALNVSGEVLAADIPTPPNGAPRGL